MVVVPERYFALNVFHVNILNSPRGFQKLPSCLSINSTKSIHFNSFDFILCHSSDVLISLWCSPLRWLWTITGLCNLRVSPRRWFKIRQALKSLRNESRLLIRKTPLLSQKGKDSKENTETTKSMKSKIARDHRSDSIVLLRWNRISRIECHSESWWKIHCMGFRTTNTRFGSDSVNLRLSHQLSSQSILWLNAILTASSMNSFSNIDSSSTSDNRISIDFQMETITSSVGRWATSNCGTATDIAWLAWVCAPRESTLASNRISNGGSIKRKRDEMLCIKFHTWDTCWGRRTEPR